MLRRVFLVGFQGVPSPLGGEVLFVLEIIRGVLQAQAKGVPLEVSLVQAHLSTVGIHHLKFLFNLHRMLTPIQFILQHQHLYILHHHTPLQSYLN